MGSALCMLLVHVHAHLLCVKVIEPASLCATIEWVAAWPGVSHAVNFVQLDTLLWLAGTTLLVLASAAFGFSLRDGGYELCGLRSSCAHMG